MNRIREGFCGVPNPFNRHQVSRVLLDSRNVDVLVFWTRNAYPMLKYLNELNDLGYKYYFQYSVLGYPRQIDPKSPSLKASLKIFSRLSEMIGPERVIFRYDPVILTDTTDSEFHVKAFNLICSSLRDKTYRCVVSIVDDYKKARGRVNELSRSCGFALHQFDPGIHGALLARMSEIARDNGIEIESCAENIKLQQFGILPGKCIDNAYIEKVFGLRLSAKKDPTQRDACGCVVSKDIGAYDTCLMGCRYCYATSSFEKAMDNFKKHDPRSPCLVPGVCRVETLTRIEAEPQQKLFD